MRPIARSLAAAAAIFAMSAAAARFDAGAGAGGGNPVGCAIRIAEVSLRTDGSALVTGRTRTDVNGDRLARARWRLELPVAADGRALRAEVEPVHVASCVRSAGLTAGDRFRRDDVRTRYRDQHARGG
ncbi:MAG: hypothetical protein ACKOWF_06670 [Chloroflexota bacterium]